MDHIFMEQALKLAHKARLRGEVPVGAVLVSPDGEVIARGENLRETLTTPLGHAEMLVLHRAAKKLKTWRLSDCTLYVTLEPCVMCAGAIQQARVGRVVYGASDPKAGGVESLYKILSDHRLNHQVQITGGIMAEECSRLLTDFFGQRREESRQEKAGKKYRFRSSVLVLHDKKVLGFHAEDPTSGVPYFFLPGGAIEDGESPVTSAVRESLEETGYRVKIFEESAVEKKYDFFWNGETRHCHTVFYLGVLDQDWHPPGPIEDASYHRGVEWIPQNRIAEIFKYDATILAAVQKLMKVAPRYLRKT